MERQISEGSRGAGSASALDPNSLLPAKSPLGAPRAPDLLIRRGRRMAAAGAE